MLTTASIFAAIFLLLCVGQITKDFVNIIRAHRKAMDEKDDR